MTDSIKARHGVWTPWAQVLCIACNYAVLKDGPQAKHYEHVLKTQAAMDRTEEVGRTEGQQLATCTTCRCGCWVRDDVALLQQVGFKTSDLDWEGPFGWALQQTGGMCCALVFTTEGRQIVITAMDGTFSLGEYAYAEGDEEESWDRSMRTWESASLYLDGAMKDASALTVMVEECARKAIEFIRAPAAPAKEAP